MKPKPAEKGAIFVYRFISEDKMAITLYSDGVTGAHVVVKRESDRVFIVLECSDTTTRTYTPLIPSEALELSNYLRLAVEAVSREKHGG